MVRFGELLLTNERKRLAAMVHRMADYTGGHGEPPSPTPWDIERAILEGAP